MRLLKSLFADASCYIATVPGYVGGPMAFGWGSDQPAHREVPLAELKRRFETAGIRTRYYNSAVHQAAFALPGYVAELTA
jgi:spermidine synthase